MISRVQPIVAVQVLARGARAMRGTCCFVERVDDVGELAAVLPRLADDIAYVVVEREQNAGTFAALRVRRRKVQEALEWLIQYSPAYEGVSLERTRLQQLPEDGPLQVRTVVADDEEASESAVPGSYGVAPEQTDVPADQDDNSVSGVVGSGDPGAGCAKKVLSAASQLAQGCEVGAESVPG